MYFFQNPEIIFCHIFHILNFFFEAQYHRSVWGICTLSSKLLTAKVINAYVFYHKIFQLLFGFPVSSIVIWKQTT